MRKILRFSLVAALLSVGAACATPKPSSKTADQTAPSASAAAPKEQSEKPADSAAVAPLDAPKALEATLPTVKVIEAGAEPKRALRYKFKAGASETVEMDMKMSMTMAMGAQGAPKVDLPTIRTILRIDVADVSPEGDMHCTFRTEKVEVKNDAKLDSALRSKLETDLAGLIGSHGKSRVTSRGVASEMDFELPANAPATLQSQLDSMRDTMRNMYVPLPEEAVGKGAKWDVSSRVPVSGAMMDTKITYSLLSLAADSATADVKVALSAPANQPMKLAALPPGAAATLLSLQGEGTGKVTPSFVNLVGSGNNRLTMDSAFRVAMGKENVEMKMATEVAIAVRRGKAHPAARRNP